ncbi:MAG: hypothetical protein AB7T37_07405 [Dehalococcoidia bacterium]
MAVPVRVPASPGNASGRIIEWYRPDGAELQPGDPVVCVENDDVVFDVEAETGGVLHQRAAAGESPLPSNVVAFIAAPGEEPPLDIEPEPAARAMPHAEPPAVHQPMADYVPGAPIPLRRGALGPPREFTRGGAWDRVFGSTEDGHIDDLWPHADTSHVNTDALHAPAVEESEPASDAFDFQAEPADVPFSLAEAVAGDAVEPAFADPTPVESVSSWDEALPAVVGEMATAYAPGFEVPPSEAFGAQHWLDSVDDDDGVVVAMPYVQSVAEEPMAWPEPAPIYIAPPPLILRGTIRMTEARKLCDQLGREWRDAPARPENEDLVLRAIARAAAERELSPPDGGNAGLVIPLAGGDRIAILSGAARGSFKEQVARLDQSPREASYADCALTLVSFRHFGIEEATPLLPDGHSVAFATGALRPGAMEGDVPVPVMVLTMAYNPDALSMGDAALLFARVGELIEAPYALLAD